MIHARCTDGSFILGIDAGNVQRLKRGQPIVVDLSNMGGRDRVMIVYGQTLADILAELQRAHGGPLPIAQPLATDTGKQ